MKTEPLDGLMDTFQLATLLHSCVVDFGELDWSPGVCEQVIGRLQRDGQEQSVLVYGSSNGGPSVDHNDGGSPK